MKKILIIVFALTSMSAYAQENNFVIKADFANLLDMDSIYMQSYGPKGMETIASGKIKNGKFELTGYIEWEDNYYFSARRAGAPKEEVEFAQLFVEKRTLSYSGEYGRYPLYKVTGSKYAKNVYEFHTNEAYQALRNKMLEMMAVQNPSDEHKVAMQKQNEKLHQYTGNVEYTWFDEAHPKHQIHLADQYYYDKKFDEFLIQVDKVEKKYPSHPGARRLGYVKSFYLERKAKEEKGESKKTRVGTRYDDVTAMSPAGQEVKLSDVLKDNKLVLLDFWASWCGPCRGEFPHLRLAYKAYKDKGFEIFAVSLDDKDEKWRKALADEKTTWINTADLSAFNSESVKNYEIRGIPYNVLINTEGEIIGENLRGEGLEEKLQEVLD